MKKIYFLSKEKDVPYTFEELEERKILLSDELIWTEGLPDWTEARNIPELQSIIVSRPPKSSKEKLFDLLKDSLFKSVKFWIVFSLAIGISAGVLEKIQFDSFYRVVKKNYDKEVAQELKLKEEQQKREYEERIRKENIERERAQRKVELNQFIQRRNFLNNQIGEYLRIVESELRSRYPNFQRIDEIEQMHLNADAEIKDLDKKISSLRIDDYSSKSNFVTSEDIKNAQPIRLTNYDIPGDLNFIMDKNGKLKTRWCIISRNVPENEQTSYDRCHKYLFRAYRAFYTSTPLSESEQKNIFVLLLNFIHSTLVTNLMFLPLLIFIYLIIDRGKMKLKVITE